MNEEIEYVDVEGEDIKEEVMYDPFLVHAPTQFEQLLQLKQQILMSFKETSSLQIDLFISKLNDMKVLARMHKVFVAGVVVDLKQMEDKIQGEYEKYVKARINNAEGKTNAEVVNYDADALNTLYAKISMFSQEFMDNVVETYTSYVSTLKQ